MTALWIILGLLGLSIVTTLIRAAFFKEPKKDKVKLEPEMVNLEKYCQDLSDAIKIKTISNYDASLVDWNEFDKFHAFLEERFPLVHNTMTKTKVADASLVFEWKGTDPDLDGIAMLAHHWRCSSIGMVSAKAIRTSNRDRNDTCDKSIARDNV